MGISQRSRAGTDRGNDRLFVSHHPFVRKCVFVYWARGSPQGESEANRSRLLAALSNQPCRTCQHRGNPHFPAAFPRNTDAPTSPTHLGTAAGSTLCERRSRCSPLDYEREVNSWARRNKSSLFLVRSISPLRIQLGCLPYIFRSREKLPVGREQMDAGWFGPVLSCQPRPLHLLFQGE